MVPTRHGSFRLFRLFGIDVFLHWSWFVVALIEFQYRSGRYSSPVWNALEYLTLFAIVLVHEFGHALACRQVGGQANQIVLWPLGGVAYVSPPQRPGAMLWSIAAGPLVNVLLVPILGMLLWLVRSIAWTEPPAGMLDGETFVETIFIMNAALLFFNLLPVFPLDGGQMLRSLLWFAFGRARSLMIASSIGFVGVAGMILLAIVVRSVWFGILSGFILLNCWGGLLRARALSRIANAPRRAGFACPACQVAPPVGAFWGCGQCRKAFDTFETGAVCPHCGAQYTATSCPECGSLRPISEWVNSSSVPPGSV